MIIIARDAYPSLNKISIINMADAIRLDLAVQALIDTELKGR